MKTKYVTSNSSLRESISRGLVNMLQGVYLNLRKDRKQWAITKNELRLMPDGSLGKDLYLFLMENDFELIPKAEFHDVYHVLLKHGVTIKDESMIQCTVVGNGRSTLPSIICTMVSVVFFPEHWRDFSIAYKRGRKANVFHNWNFEALLLESTKDIRDQILN